MELKDLTEPETFAQTQLLKYTQYFTDPSLTEELVVMTLMALITLE